MRRHRIFRFAALVLLHWPGASGARPVQERTPEELESRASLVCNGTVVSVTKTGIEKDSSYDAGLASVPEIVMQARIKVLHVFKGKAPMEIIFRYRVSKPPLVAAADSVATSSRDQVAEGPQHVALEVGKHYRFFLKTDWGHRAYVNVLEGDSDDAFAVEPLWPSEPDDASYLTQDEVVRIAHDYLKSKKSAGNLDWAHLHIYSFPEKEGLAWSVGLYDAGEGGSNSTVVIVRGDRTVDASQSKISGR